MRFRDHLADLPKEIPGGQKAPEAYDKSKILRLEEEARKLREMIEKKEDAKRGKLKEWDTLERDAETGAHVVADIAISESTIDREDILAEPEFVGRLLGALDTLVSHQVEAKPAA